MSTDTLVMIHIYLPFAKLIQLACCTARQQSREPNTPTNIRCRECCHSICKQRRCNCPILGCLGSGRTNEQRIYSQPEQQSFIIRRKFEREKGQKKVHSATFEPTNSRLYLWAIYSASPKKVYFLFTPIRPRSKVNRFPNRSRFRINRTIRSPDSPLRLSCG